MLSPSIIPEAKNRGVTHENFTCLLWIFMAYMAHFPERKDPSAGQNGMPRGRAQPLDIGGKNAKNEDQVWRKKAL